MPNLRFPTGVATRSGAYVAVQVSDDSGQVIPGTLYADYQFSPNPEGFATDWIALSLCYRETEDAVYAAGADGEILRIAASGNSQEFIAPATHGPDVQGPIREIRTIGNHVFAVGMGRQVYRRGRDPQWQRYDTGILDVSDRMTSGLNSIAGNGQGILAAVGYEGEIWELHDGWQQIDSPTNVLLTRVVEHTGTLYAAGVLGTVLFRDAEGWRVIDTGEFALDIWGMESFGGRLFLGTAQGLFWMAPDGIVHAVDPGTFTSQTQCASLSAGQDRLWCFGGDKVSSTGDGVLWREEVIFSGP